jgi:hypothetical protein
MFEPELKVETEEYPPCMICGGPNDMAELCAECGKQNDPFPQYWNIADGGRP